MTSPKTRVLRAASRDRLVRGEELRSLAAVRAAVIDCSRCPRLRGYCERVVLERKRAFRDQVYWGKPVPGFGDPRARLLVVGLAPAAHGANRTGRMFTGDQSGDWLYEALHRFGFASQPASGGADDGLRLSDCYVTAAARCAPPDNRPTLDELERCREYLAAEVRLLRRVRVVVTLGHIGHRAWLQAAGWWSLPAGARPAFGHGLETTLPSGTRLICSYHPSRQNTNTGRLTRAMWLRIFRRARALVEAPERDGTGPLAPNPISSPSPDRSI